MEVVAIGILAGISCCACSACFSRVSPAFRSHRIYPMRMENLQSQISAYEEQRSYYMTPPVIYDMSSMGLEKEKIKSVVIIQDPFDISSNQDDGTTHIGFLHTDTGHADVDNVDTGERGKEGQNM